MKEWFRRQPKHFTPASRENGQQIPDNMWVKCPSCGELNYVKQLNDNLKVCKCGYHMRLSAHEWLCLLDNDSFVEEDAVLGPTDPLGFVSPKDNYSEKLAEKQNETGMLDAIVSGYGAITGLPLQITVAEFDFIGGSLGSVFGEKVAPCYGGVTASYASVADVIIAEPGANIGFAGRRVIEQAIRQKLPAHLQTAEVMLEHGMIDMVVPRSELRATLARLLRLYSGSCSDDVGSLGNNSMMVNA